MEVHFIGVEIIGYELHYTIQSATVTDGHVQDLDNFLAISEEALVSLIDELPLTRYE